MPLPCLAAHTPRLQTRTNFKRLSSSPPVADSARGCGARSCRPERHTRHWVPHGPQAPDAHRCHKAPLLASDSPARHKAKPRRREASAPSFGASFRPGDKGDRRGKPRIQQLHQRNGSYPSKSCGLTSASATQQFGTCLATLTPVGLPEEGARLTTPHVAQRPLRAGNPLSLSLSLSIKSRLTATRASTHASLNQQKAHTRAAAGVRPLQASAEQTYALGH